MTNPHKITINPKLVSNLTVVVNQSPLVTVTASDDVIINWAAAAEAIQEPHLSMNRCIALIILAVRDGTWKEQP